MENVEELIQKTRDEFRKMGFEIMEIKLKNNREKGILGTCLECWIENGELKCIRKEC